MKFEEMEEKMRRQKMKGAHKNTESEENENTVKPEDDTDPEVEHTDQDTEAGYSPTMAPLFSAGGESTADSAEVLDAHQSYIATTLPPPAMIETATLALAEEQPTYTQIQRVPSPLPPRTYVESERLHLVEIKSDGSSGHLVRLPSGGYQEDE